MAVYFAAFVMIAALLLGGGGGKSGYLSDALLQLLAIPVLLFACWQLSVAKLSLAAKLAIFLWLALVGVHLIQLLPLPPPWRAMLPGHDVVVSSLQAAGMSEPWMPLTLSARATWLSLAALIPPLTVFLITLGLSYRGRRLLALMIVAIGLFSVFIGMLQVAQGHSSPLRFFGSDGPPEATGFFANRNHFSALIYTLILLVLAWLSTQLGQALANSPGHKIKATALTRLLAGMSILVVLIGAQMMARSRAGVGLTMAALLGAFALTFAKQRATEMAKLSRKLAIGIGALVLVFVLSSQFALYRILDRLDDKLLEGGRATIAETTMQAIWSFMPTGSGMGSFVPVYAMFEKTRDLHADRYVNRAHNDVLEFCLEAGIIALVLMALFAVFYIARTIVIWRHRPDSGQTFDQALARAATIIIGLLIAHSLVDYPLRTAAMASIFAFATALLIDPAVGPKDLRGGRLSNLADWLELSGKSRRQSSKRRKTAHLSQDMEVGQHKTPSQFMPTRAPAPQSIEQTEWGKDIKWPAEWGGSKPSDTEEQN